MTNPNLEPPIRLTRYCPTISPDLYAEWLRYKGTADGDRFADGRYWLVVTEVRADQLPDESGYACTLTFQPYPELTDATWEGDAPPWVDHQPLLDSFMGATSEALPVATTRPPTKAAPNIVRGGGSVGAVEASTTRRTTAPAT